MRKKMNRKMNRMQGEKGFTILDTLAAFAISGLLLTMTGPAIGDVLAHYRLRGATSQVGFELTRARMQAMAQSAWVRVRFTQDGYVVERSDDGTSFDEVYATASLPDGVRVSGVSSPPTFDRQGVATDDIEVKISNGGGQRVVEMNSIGKIRESGFGSVWES
jgi:type II secretory pathway pseudopilin PulG